MVNASMGLCLTEDKWLSRHLGKDAFRLDTPGDDASSLVGAIAKLGDPKFVYCKVPASEVRTVHALEAAGFRLVDTFLTLERPMLPPVPNKGGTRLARPEDRLGVIQIAREGFSFSRFHSDPQIEMEIANEIKADWAGNFFLGQRGDAMIVAEQSHRIVGFLQLLRQHQSLIIDLIAVHPCHRRQGRAAAMIACAQGHFSNLDIMRVGTQAANIPAMRLYIELGFRLVSAQQVFHYHSPQPTI